MSERLTHSDVFGGILTNSEIHHFGGAHTGTEVAYSGEPIDRLFEIENMCYDQLGREVISIARLRELAEAERENRLTVYKYPNCYACPKLPKSNLWQNNEPCKSCHDRALAATEPKGDAKT